MFPDDRRYSREHEWVRVEGSTAVIGITSFAADELGDIVYVELPEVGRQVKQGEVFGTIESVKAVSELFSTVSGEVLAVNADLTTHPEAVNAKPHEAWMIRLRPSAPAEADKLLSAAAYTDLVK